MQYKYIENKKADNSTVHAHSLVSVLSAFVDYLIIFQTHYTFFKH